MKQLIYILTLLTLPFWNTFQGLAQRGYAFENNVWFTENKGQWETQAAYKVNIPSGQLYLEENRFLFHFLDINPLINKHREFAPEVSANPELRGHAYEVEFVGANQNIAYETERPSSFYYNYFKGKDQSKWASGVLSYEGVRYKSLYNNIDLKVYGKHNRLKYDFVVSPGGNPEEIQLRYNGALRVQLVDGQVQVTTSINLITEKQPIAYQYVDGLFTKIPCEYRLENNVLYFDFPEGYDTSLPLVIDPELDFSTFSGSTADNWGFTATYDEQGSIYAAGIVFGEGYPTTVGAFTENFQSTIGNTLDIGLTKYTPDGTQQVYSTYLGGRGSETPLSLVVNNNDELFVLSNTSSDNFPTSANCMGPTFNGGSNATWSIINFAEGTDLAVTKFDPNGALLASTYVGGAGNDGLNQAFNLAFNYGDQTRGEIIATDNNTCIVASSTYSKNFPIQGAPQPVSGGGQDGCVFELNADFSALVWGTYLGGAKNDGAYSVQQDLNGNVFVSGGTESTDFPVKDGLNTTYRGGTSDGFIVKLNPTGSAVESSTYIGTNRYDQCYFVQLDPYDDVFVYGQTEGAYPISGGVYANANSGQFIHKLNNNLDTDIFSSTFGNGTGKVDISPCAFLVDQCGKIYVSGWGGQSNNFGGNGATQSKTTGLPVTADAYQKTTDGNDFYVAVFDENMTGLDYATFFGGNLSGEHVDGGTSRFDKRGYMYQAVCAGCGGNSDFPTTGGVWSETNKSHNCNIGAFKFKLSKIKPAVSSIDPIVCLTKPVEFVNNSVGGNTYFWDFGDGGTSDEFSPSHFYADTGTYVVKLVVSDSLGCLIADTSEILVEVMPMYQISAPPVDTICPGDTVDIQLTGGYAYEWSPTTALSNPLAANSMAWPNNTMTYRIVSAHECGNDTAQVTVPVHDLDIFVADETNICIGNSVQLYAGGGISYSWLPAESLSDPTSSTPIATPDQTTLYSVEITTDEACEVNETVLVTVDTDVPTPMLNEDVIICENESIIGTASGAREYYWSPDIWLSDDSTATPVIEPDQTITYTVEFRNACGSEFRSFTVQVNQDFAEALPDQTVCTKDTAYLWAGGGETYLWSPADLVSDSTAQSPYVWLEEEQQFQVIVFDSVGCPDTAYTHVALYEEPWVNAGADQELNWGNYTQLEATSSGLGTFYWHSEDSLMSCVDCFDPIVGPLQTTDYKVVFVDKNGCRATDSLRILLDGVLYVPNTFTPDNDGTNDFFKAEGQEIAEFNMWIFDRWGLLIYNSDNIDQGWDGRFNGSQVQVDTYVWKIEYEDNRGNKETLYGHVNVVR